MSVPLSDPQIEYFCYVRDYGPTDTPFKERVAADYERLSRLPNFDERKGASIAEDRSRLPLNWVRLHEAAHHCYERYVLVIPDLDEFRRRLDVLSALLEARTWILLGSHPTLDLRQTRERLATWKAEAQKSQLTAQTSRGQLLTQFWYVRDCEGVPHGTLGRGEADIACLAKIKSADFVGHQPVFEDRSKNKEAWAKLFGCLRDSCKFVVPILVPDLDEFRGKPDILRAISYFSAELYLGSYPDASPDEVRKLIEGWIVEAERGRGDNAHFSQAFPRNAPMSRPAKRRMVDPSIGRKGVETRKRNAADYNAKVLPIIAELMGQHPSFRFVAEELTRMEVLTARGGTKWSAMQVSRIWKSRQGGSDCSRLAS